MPGPQEREEGFAQLHINQQHSFFSPSLNSKQTFETNIVCPRSARKESISCFHLIMLRAQENWERNFETWSRMSTNFADHGPGLEQPTIYQETGNAEFEVRNSSSVPPDFHAWTYPFACRLERCSCPLLPVSIAFPTVVKLRSRKGEEKNAPSDKYAISDPKLTNEHLSSAWSEKLKNRQDPELAAGKSKVRSVEIYLKGPPAKHQRRDAPLPIHAVVISTFVSNRHCTHKTPKK